MSNKTIIILLVSVIVIGIIVFFVFFNKKSDADFIKTNAVASGAGSQTQNFSVLSCSLDNDTSLDWHKTIANGSVNCEAARLQKEMNKNITFPYATLTVDGFFGPKSEAELFRQKGVKSTTLNFYKGFNFQ